MANCASHSNNNNNNNKPVIICFKERMYSYIYCCALLGEVRNCDAPYFFAFNGGLSCCDVNTCNNAIIDRANSNCCDGNVVLCDDGDGDSCFDAS